MRKQKSFEEKQNNRNEKQQAERTRQIKKAEGKIIHQLKEEPKYRAEIEQKVKEALHEMLSVDVMVTGEEVDLLSILAKRFSKHILGRVTGHTPSLPALPGNLELTVSQREKEE